MSVLTEVLFWFTVFLGTGALLFCSVYKLILYADLSVDHINPIQLCEYVNFLMLPEYIGHVTLVTLVLFRGFVIAALLNTPLMLFHLRRYTDRKHVLQSTTIFNDVDRERVIAQAKLAYHLLMFFVYLYFFIATLIAD